MSGGTIAIASFAYYVYLHRAEFKNSKWIWFLPSILSGCLFKYMHWAGANIIIFSSLAILILMTSIQLVRLRNCTKVQAWLLVWQLVMCGCIVVFYFRYVKLDSFIIGYIFSWLAVVYILLQNENKFQNKNDIN